MIEGLLGDPLLCAELLYRYPASLLLRDPRAPSLVPRSHHLHHCRFCHGTTMRPGDTPRKRGSSDAYRRADWDRARKDPGLAVMAAQRTREISASAHGVGARVGVYQSLLFLSLGCGVGWRVLEDQRLRPFSHLDLAQRPRMDQTTVGKSGDWVRSLG